MPYCIPGAHELGACGKPLEVCAGSTEDGTDIVTTGGILMRTYGAEVLGVTSGAKLMRTSRLAELLFTSGGKIKRTYGPEELAAGF